MPDASTSAMALTPASISSFSPAKVYKEKDKINPSCQFTDIDMDNRGEQLLTVAEDDAMHIYDCKQGKHAKPLYSKKYGCHLARFTQHRSAIVHTSTKGENALRLLDTKKSSYVRYYRGHTGLVTSLNMAPNDDTMLSASEDATVRLWDVRVQEPQGLLNTPTARPTAAFDNTGTVFVVMHNFKTTLALYDVRRYDQAPFISERLHDPVLERISYPPRTPFFTSTSFSRDGKWLLVGTSGPVHYVLDAFSCGVVARLEGHGGFDAGQPMEPPRHSGSGSEVCWTPDSRFVLAGTADGNVCVWDVNPPDNPPAQGPEVTLQPISVLSGAHQNTPVRAIAFNPRLAMFATGGTELALWTPNVGKGDEVIRSG